MQIGDSPNAIEILFVSISFASLNRGYQVLRATRLPMSLAGRSGNCERFKRFSAPSRIRVCHRDAYGRILALYQVSPPSGVYRAIDLLLGVRFFARSCANDGHERFMARLRDDLKPSIPLRHCTPIGAPGDAQQNIAAYLCDCFHGKFYGP